MIEVMINTKSQGKTLLIQVSKMNAVPTKRQLLSLIPVSLISPLSGCQAADQTPDFAPSKCPSVGFWGRQRWEQDEVHIGYSLPSEKTRVFFVAYENDTQLGVEKISHDGELSAVVDGASLQLDTKLKGSHTIRVETYWDENWNGEFDPEIDRKCAETDPITVDFSDPFPLPPPLRLPPVTPPGQLVSSDIGPRYQNTSKTSAALDDDSALVGSTALSGQEDTGPPFGSVYSFHRTEEGWTTHKQLILPGHPRHGRSLALDGTRAVINTGAVFERDGETWHRETTLPPFGDRHWAQSVDIDGDIAMLGPSDPAQESVEGHEMLVFKGIDGTWTEQATLRPSEIRPKDDFGNAVALQDNIAIIGANQTRRDDWSGSGAIYVFERANGSWEQRARFTSSGSTEFGRAIALDRETALVGALNAPRGEKNRVGVFTRGSDGWFQETTLTAPVDQENTQFGRSVALSKSIALVGARSASAKSDGTRISNAGAVYAFDRESWTLQKTYTAPTPKEAEFYGDAIAVDEELALICGGAVHEVAGTIIPLTYLITL
jgi:hypothetical protein